VRAWNLTRADHFYRHEVFNEGLRAFGYEIQKTQPRDFRPGDLVLIWNRYSSNLAIAASCEAAGGRVVVAENGYLGIGGVSPHHMENRDPYAMSLGWHNDSTCIKSGDSSRWDALGIEVRPWQNNAGGHILIAPNRPFGAPGRAMPFDWATDAALRYRNLTGLPVRIRNHPGNHRPPKPLAEDLVGAYACVVWSSSAGVHSLVAGVPVFCEAPFWICKDAAHKNPYDKKPIVDLRSQRIAALYKLAHGQFFVDEIRSGEAFAWLLK
jgi:hypothetical protein